MIYLEVTSWNSASTDNLLVSLEMENRTKLHVLFASLEPDEIIVGWEHNCGWMAKNSDVVFKPQSLH